MDETVNQETTAPAAAQTAEQQPAPQQAPTAAERTFTQAEVDALVRDRLARVRGKYADYDDLKAKAALYDTAQTEHQEALQAATDRSDALQAQLDQLNAANALREVRDRVAADTGVPAELLTCDTEEACRAQAEAVLRFKYPGYPAVKDGGEAHNTLSGSPREQFAAWFGQALK